MSTGQGLLGNNMFAYCVNNPVNMADPTGHCSYFLFFKKDCFSATCPDSQCYNPDAPNVLLFMMVALAVILVVFMTMDLSNRAPSFADVSML